METYAEKLREEILNRLKAEREEAHEHITGILRQGARGLLTVKEVQAMLKDADRGLNLINAAIYYVRSCQEGAAK